MDAGQSVRTVRPLCVITMAVFLANPGVGVNRYGVTV